jgi:hypothetical protein
VVLAPTLTYLLGERFTSHWLDRGMYLGAAVLTAAAFAVTARMRRRDRPISARPTRSTRPDPIEAASG